mmetsp:Transcript_92004/g.213828  ORF Transcript_92004/g.213828 Transcript_92004/m.213828 type:complete len:333 (-) Transcript_92004:260-1258(-)
MIDFEDLDDVDVNVQLRATLEGLPLPRGLAKGLERANDDEAMHDVFVGLDEMFECAKEPRRSLPAEHVCCHALNPTLVVLVPFREDEQGTRGRQLKKMVSHFETRFLPALPSHLQARVVILEQTDNGPFNRGKLLNIGARWGRVHVKNEVILCPHDVDMLPDPSLAPYYSHYHPGECVHLGWVSRKYDYENFFGGVCAIPMEDFFSVGGFPNEFWGWGREDDVLHGRLRALAGVRVLVPASDDGMTFQGGETSGVGRPSARSESENLITVQHLLGFDNIFDPPAFTVVDHEERDWLCHLLLELQPERVTELQPRGSSARSLGELLRTCRQCL